MTVDVKQLRCVYRTADGRRLHDSLPVSRLHGSPHHAPFIIGLRSVGKTDLEGWGPLDGPAARVKEVADGGHCWFVPWDEWLATERWAAGVGEA